MQDTSYFGNWFIPTKIEPERPSISLVERPRLTETLTRWLQKKLVLIVAPAGFGKSTIVAQWRDELLRDQVLCPWLSLDENDFEGRQFLSYLTLSLAAAGLELDELVVGAKNGFADSSERVILRRLISEIELTDTPCVMVLDDYHRVRSPKIDTLLMQLIKETPPSFTILLTSRVMPDIDCATLIAAGLAVELGPDGLRLTEEEAMKAVGADFVEGDFPAIYAKTEGWPVAVQLARLGSQSLTTFPAAAAGHSTSFIASYLTEQVVNSLDDETKQFLLSTSVFGRFSADLLNHVLDKPDAWSTMAKLNQLGAFIIPMDKEGRWFRYHHLFSEYLFETLRKSNWELVRALCSRASDWHWQNGQLVEAASYAAKVKDYQRCADIILDLGAWQIIVTRGIGFMRKLLRFIPEEELKTFPRVALARTYLHCKDGELQQARFLFDSTGWSNRACEDVDWLQDHLLVGQLLGVYQDMSISPDDLGTFIDSARKRLPGLDSLSVGTLRCMEASGLFANAHMEPVRACLEDAAQLMRQGGSVLGLNYCYIHACVDALYRCDFESAVTHAKVAYEEAEKNFGADSGLKYIANTLRFAIAVWSGRATEADLQAFVTALADLEEHDGWTEIYLIGLDAGYHLAASRSDWATAYAIVERYQSVASIRDLARLKLFCSVLKVEVARHAGEDDDGISFAGKLLELTADAEDNRNWCASIIAATKLFDLGLVTGGEVEQILDDHARWAQGRTLNFFHVRLVAAQAEFYLARGNDSRLVERLSALVALCARHDFFWPFKVNAALKMALYTHRDNLGASSEGVNRVFVDKFLSGWFESDQPRGPGILSLRERQVLSCLAEGQSNKLIARELDLTDNTVKFHLKNIYMKLSVSRRGEAVFEARRKGLI